MSAMFWDGVARKYAKAAIGNPKAYEVWLARVVNRLGRHDEILEVGCGTASTALRLAPFVSRMVASDYSREMIAIADEKLAGPDGPDNLTLLCADVFDPVLKEHKGGAGYSAVLGFNFLHLAESPAAAVAQMASLARPGGLVITKTACLKYKSLYLLPLVKILQFLGKAPPVRMLSVSEVDEMMEMAGLRLLETDTIKGVVDARFIIAQKL